MWGVLSDERTGLSFTLTSAVILGSESLGTRAFSLSDPRLPFLSARSVCYNGQPDGLEDTMSNPSISCSPMQRWLTYSLPPKLK
jgi:hypothetical protein